MTGATYSNYTHAPSSNTAPSYDQNGNRTNVPPSKYITSTTGAANRLVFDGTSYFAYDAEGNCIQRTNAVTGVITGYTWNNDNQLTSVRTYGNVAAFKANSPTSTVYYQYDAFGRMVTRTVGSTVENYVYDGENLALVLNAGGQVTERDLYVAALDQVLATENATSWNNGVTWFLTDNQGTVRDLAAYNYQPTALGTVLTGHIVYDAFGQITWEACNPSSTTPTAANLSSLTPSSPANQPRFTYDGMRQDLANGLYYDKARWYDPANGVFISQDPLGFGGGDTNTSRYCGNSPTNYVDPSGMGCLWNPVLWFNGAGNPKQSWLDYLNPLNSESRAAIGGAYLGEKQGELNMVNGLQDAAIGTANTAIIVGDYVFDDRRATQNELFESPQWAAGKIVQLDPTTQKISQVCGGQGAFMLLTCGAGAASEGMQVPSLTCQLGANGARLGAATATMRLGVTMVPAGQGLANGSVALANIASLRGVGMMYCQGGQGSSGGPTPTRPNAPNNPMNAAIQRGMKTLRGRDAPDRMVDVLKKLGKPMSREQIGDVIHAVKAKMNIGAAEDVVFDYSGGMWDSRTGEYIGKMWDAF